VSGPVAPIARSVLTLRVLSHLTNKLPSPILVSSGIAPPGGGWVSGQPGGSDFVGYTVIKTGVASLLEADSLASSGQSWKCAYQLSSSGGNESHADDVADQVREAMVSFPESLTLRDVLWGVQRVEFNQLGAPSMNAAVDPPFWNVTDAVSLWLSRARGQR